MWRAFCQQLKECGRNGSLFIFALLGVLAGALLITAMGKVALTVLWLFGAGVLARACARVIRQSRPPPRLGKFPPLSSEDLRVARLKLRSRRPQR
jgi:uncharacterized membrane protein HdeD (DUF308 family)